MIRDQGNARNRNPSITGFSLVELLVVMAVIAILSAASLPLISSGMRSMGLTTTGQLVTNQLTLARQTALSSSHAVQVRFYYLPEFNSATPTTAPLAVYRGMQSFTEGDPTVAGPQLTAITKPIFFSAPVVISGDTVVSPFLPATPIAPGSTDLPLPSYQANYKYAVFRFKPDGSTDLAAAANSFTLVLENSSVVANHLPTNFQTVAIDPMIGSIRSFRP